MIYLREIEKIPGSAAQGYPLGTAVLANLNKLSFSHSVSIFCGENGSGKTSLMSLIAAGLRAQMIGEDGVKEQRSALFMKAARQFKFVLGSRPRQSFYFTAEDFSRYLDARQRMAQEARAGLDSIREDYAGRSDYARSQAAQPFARTLDEMEGQFERDLLQSSHGEGFLSFFAGRLTRKGLYLLDEPEGALSYANQLSLLALIDSAVQAEGQVIMATHSPVLAAYPNAALMEISEGGIEDCAYEGLSGVQFLKHFMAHREGILKRAGIEGEISTRSDQRL